MHGTRTVVVAVALLAVIAVAIGYTVKSRFRKPTAPQWLREQPVEKVDEKTLEVMTLSFAEWEKLGAKDGYCRNPKTGEYQMCGALTCASCGHRGRTSFHHC